MNLNGTRLLFINAHLAAHGDKAHLRLANLQKIKAELTVETFLKPEDPRNMAEGLSTILEIGAIIDWRCRYLRPFRSHFLIWRLKLSPWYAASDLGLTRPNHLSDISRLHADWLISQKGAFCSYLAALVPDNLS